VSDFLATYEAQLLDAARRELPGRRRWPRFVAICLVGLAAAGVPAAAHNGWFPFAGRADAPTTTSASPTAELRGMLAVLRRPQTEADRRAARYALRFFGQTFQSVQTDYVRRAGAVILVPAKSHQLTPDSAVQRDVVCLWRTDFSDGGARACFEASQIRAGVAVQSVGRRVDMLVPDVVARVRVGGTVEDITPRDNVASWQGRMPNAIAWYGADGAPIAMHR
jgi:hypothetical protein